MKTKGPIRILLSLMICACMSLLGSCAGIYSGLTGQPVPTTPVQREGGKPVQVATADLLQAEAGDPETAYGLYDAGAVAAQVARAVDTGK